MVSTIFEIGALGFWILSSVVSIIIICLLSAPKDPKYGWSTVFIFGTFVLLFYFGGRTGLNNLWLWIKENPGQFVLLFILYVIIGVLWSFAEWFWFVKKRAEIVCDPSDIKYYKPKISKEKDRIFTWIFYWPWVMLWKGIHKPFTRIFNFIYIHTEATYQRMTDSAFKKFEEKK